MGRRTQTDAVPKPLTAVIVRSVARALEGMLAEIQGGAATATS